MSFVGLEMEKRLSMATRNELIEVEAQKYRKGLRAERSVILNQRVEITGFVASGCEPSCPR
jgi:hypothetical protein